MQINEEVLENNLKLKDQMQSLTTNLSSLNNVYGGMLSAMGKKSSFELYKTTTKISRKMAGGKLTLDRR
jgi:hypothetical protein